MQTLNWRDAYALEGKEGNPFLTTPTREMVLELDVRKIVTWKIRGNLETIEIIFDRDYAIEWATRKLSFLRHVPSEVRDEFINELFGDVEGANNSKGSTVTKAKKR